MKKHLSAVRGSLVAVVCLALLPLASSGAQARGLQPDVQAIAREWAQIKYLSKSDSERKRKMEKLGAKADALASRYSGRVNVLIWDGIVNSERASLTWGFSALKLATKARDILKKAYRMNPAALDAGAPTSLGVLYYRVPGFPVAWGDTKKARKYLEEAVRLAPQGWDAHYFYADFLYRQGEYRKAEKILTKALQMPGDPQRPLWSKVFPRVMRSLLARIRHKEGS